MRAQESANADHPCRPIEPETATEPLTDPKAAIRFGNAVPKRIRGCPRAPVSEKNRDDARKCIEQSGKGPFGPASPRVFDRPDKT